MHEISSEAEFYTAWVRMQETAESLDQLATRGGALADRFAWVFMAGYQAAIRAVFPDLACNGWLAFAVSEDKSGQYPGLQLVDGLLRGSKSWVAGSEQVNQLVVSCHNAFADQREYRLVVLPQTGVSLVSRASPSMLPELSQGFAHFERVAVEATDLLDAQSVVHFGALEARYVCLAFCGHVVEWGDEDLAAEAQSISHALTTGEDQELAVSERVVQLRNRLQTGAARFGEQWRADSKLLAMYVRHLATDIG